MAELRGGACGSNQGDSIKDLMRKAGFKCKKFTQPFVPGTGMDPHAVSYSPALGGWVAVQALFPLSEVGSAMEGPVSDPDTLQPQLPAYNGRWCCCR
jgi:hypothetical protein